MDLLVYPKAVLLDDKIVYEVDKFYLTKQLLIDAISNLKKQIPIEIISSELYCSMKNSICLEIELSELEKNMPILVKAIFEKNRNSLCEISLNGLYISKKYLVEEK